MTSDRPSPPFRGLTAGLIWLCTAAGWGAAGGAAEPAVVELGDPRKTVVTISDAEDHYQLGVRLLAVKSLDERSDREANRSLARSGALTALTRHLRVGRGKDLVVGAVQAGGERTEEDAFVLTFTVPKSGVKIVDRPEETREPRLDPEFAPYLLAEPLLMETDGAKVIGLDDGRVLVLGVASAVLRDGSAADRKRAETVARQRALAHVVAEKSGVQVARAETILRKTTVTIDDASGERAESVADYLETTQAKLRGATRDFPIVGRWTSEDGTLASVAVGGFLERPAAGE